MNKVEWSQWINDNVEKAAIYGPLGRYDSDVIKTSSLRNLLNNITELPTVPQFVADYIEHYKDAHLTMEQWFTDADGDFEDVFEWLYDNDYETDCEREYILHTAIREGYIIETDTVEDITDKLVNHIRSDDFEDILRSSVRAFIIRDGIK